MAYTYIGEPEQAIAYADKAMRLSPHDPRSIGQHCISPRPSPSASCRTMSRRLYGLSGLKLLLPRCCSWDLCGLRCLPWRVKRTRRAQQCSAIWRTTMPLSGPCLNGMLDGRPFRPIVRLFFASSYVGEKIRRWPPKSRTAGVSNAVARADEVIERAARCMSLMGQSLPTRVGTLGQEPVSPSPALSFMSATALPTPARFRPPGPPMFDSPTIAS